MDSFDVQSDVDIEESDISDVLMHVQKSNVHKIVADGVTVDVKEMHTSGDSFTMITDSKYDLHPDEIKVYSDVTWKFRLTDYDNVRTKDEHYFEGQVGEVSVV